MKYIISSDIEKMVTDSELRRTDKNFSWPV